MMQFKKGRLTHRYFKSFNNPSGLTFSIFTPEEVEKLSVVKIITPLTFNDLGHPFKGGLYDPALGPLNEESGVCNTCANNVFMCSGHIGHIELPLPVVNPLFHKTVFNILKLSCLKCHNVQIKQKIKYLFITKLKLLDNGYVMEAEEADLLVQDLELENDRNNEAIDILAKEKLTEYLQNIIVNNTSGTTTTKNIERERNKVFYTMDKGIELKKICWNCKAPLKKIYFVRNKLMTQLKQSELNDDDDDDDRPLEMANDPKFSTFILPDESMKHLREIWKNDEEFITALVPVLRSCNMEHPTDVLFFNVIPVPPPKMRPVNYVANKLIEHPQSQVFKHIIQDCIILRNILKALKVGDTDNLLEEVKKLITQINGKTLSEKIYSGWEKLQADVNHLLDNEMDKSNSSIKLCLGIKQVIEKKEGIVRMHMMGKRVNFAARSVITPDPYLNIEEIGIPETFAKILTYPVPVTIWNLSELQSMILNGPDVYPGAAMIQNEDGSIIKLLPDKAVQRQSLAKRLLTPGDSNSQLNGIKVVHRHLCTGDVLLLNRQPTLHRPSIMAHIARVLKGEKTLRLHYANCKAYNADFDGDEMNAHFPQNELARSEAYNLLNVNKQYLVPKDGTPLSGLIQDHIISGVRLSVRGRFFSKEDYQQLVFQALCYKRGEIKLLPPAILKPCKMWSGKQIISTIIINTVPNLQHPLNLYSLAKIRASTWVVEKPRKWKGGGSMFTNRNSMSEAEIIIREGELLCGVLDKTQYGATPYGLVHSMFELYGGLCSSRLLSSFAKLFNVFLQREGFSLSVEDILVLKDAEKKRKDLIRNGRKIGKKTVSSALNLSEKATESEIKEKIEELYKDKIMGRMIIDSSYKKVLDTVTNDINKVCIPSGLIKKFPYNNLQLMIESGAKGSTVNSMQISCLLGQIELEGKRPPPMISGKTLPSFAQYDTSPRAGGFVDGRFLTGLKPQEFYHHCMAGREGLIDTAVKTSRSGYLQRCLVKHLEGLIVGYDMSVRDSDGSVIQFYYGEDGKDVTKSQFLSSDKINFLMDNAKNIRHIGMENLKDEDILYHLNKHKKTIKKWEKKHGNPIQKTRVSAFSLFSKDMVEQIPHKIKKINKKTGRSEDTEELCRLWQERDTETQEIYEHKSERCADPVIAKFYGGSNFGALTEKLEKMMTDYLNRTPHAAKSELCEVISLKSLLSHCDPGEPVGLLAAQSIGEPSTQMTLNTFHFAGRGEMNVTLGIPRLRELLMTGSEMIKTPSMDIPFHSHILGLEKKSADLKMKLQRVTMADVLQYINVTDKLNTKERQYMYNIHFQFLPYESYKTKFYVKPHNILRYTEEYFFKNIFITLKRNLKLKIQSINMQKSLARQSNEKDDDEEDKELNVDEDDLAKVKKSGVGEEHVSSDEEEEDDDDDATAVRSKNRHTENQDYEEEEEEILSSEEDAIEENKHNDMDIDEDYNSKENDNEFEINNSSQIREDKESITNYDIRRRRVISSISYIVDYDYDQKNFLWCKIQVNIPLQYRRLDLTSILKEVSSKSVVWEVPSIKRAITYTKQETQQLMLKTEGINFQEMFQFSNLLNHNQLYSNDIHQMAETFGIEAARRVLVKEIQEVFKVYGIIVDPRHLLLVADYMTFTGTYKSLTRKAMEDSASPLHQISFESSLTFLKTAVIRGKQDYLTSPSSRLMIGQPVIGGTGTFSLLHKLSATR